MVASLLFMDCPAELTTTFSVIIFPTVTVEVPGTIDNVAASTTEAENKTPSTKKTTKRIGESFLNFSAVENNRIRCLFFQTMFNK